MIEISKVFYVVLLIFFITGCVELTSVLVYFIIVPFIEMITNYKKYEQYYYQNRIDTAFKNYSDSLNQELKNGEENNQDGVEDND